MKIVILDAQGGGMGRQLVEGLKKALPNQPLIAVGTNALATAAMLRAGADQVATGENAVVVCAGMADLILCPIGMVLCDAMLGEVTANMALAVGRSKAHKILLPVSQIFPWQYHWQEEMQAYLDSGNKKLLEQEHIQLVNFTAC